MHEAFQVALVEFAETCVKHFRLHGLMLTIRRRYMHKYLSVFGAIVPTMLEKRREMAVVQFKELHPKSLRNYKIAWKSESIARNSMRRAACAPGEPCRNLRRNGYKKCCQANFKNDWQVKCCNANQFVNMRHQGKRTYCSQLNAKSLSAPVTSTSVATRIRGEMVTT